MENEKKESGPDALDRDKKKDEEKELEKASLDAAIGALEVLLKSSPAGRREELLTKALRGPLTDEENAELRKSLGGEEGDAGQDAVAALQSEELTKSLSLDVTGFLREIHGGVTDAVGALASRLEKGFKQQDELGFVLAKSHLDVCRILQAQGELIKSLESRLAQWGAQPAAAPRAVARPSGVVNRPFAGNQPAEDTLSKSQILDSLLELQKAKPGGQADCGEDIGFALAKYEATSKISPALYAELENFRRKSA